MTDNVGKDYCSVTWRQASAVVIVKMQHIQHASYLSNW